MNQNANVEWFIGADFGEYEGEYVAIARQQVIAHGQDPGQVYEEAKRRCAGEKILLWKVMKAGSYVFWDGVSRGR